MFISRANCLEQPPCARSALPNSLPNCPTPATQLVAQLEALATSYAAQIASIEPLISRQQQQQQPQPGQPPQVQSLLPLPQRVRGRGGIPRPSPSSRVQRLSQAAASAVPVVCVQPIAGTIAGTAVVAGHTAQHNVATCTQPNCRWCQYHARRQAQQAQQAQGRSPTPEDVLAPERPVGQASSELAAEALVLRQKFPLEPQGKAAACHSLCLCYDVGPCTVVALGQAPCRYDRV